MRKTIHKANTKKKNQTSEYDQFINNWLQTNENDIEGTDLENENDALDITGLCDFNFDSDYDDRIMRDNDLEEESEEDTPTGEKFLEKSSLYFLKRNLFGKNN